MKYDKLVRYKIKAKTAYLVKGGFGISSLSASAVENNPPTVLVAGATGYIGRHTVEALHQAGYRVRALTRDERKLAKMSDTCEEVFVGDATRIDTLSGLCDGVQVVISALGLRTFRARPTSEAVDLQGNLNILECAQQTEGVQQFTFISNLHADVLLDAVPILRPREEFVKRLQGSGLRWTVLRPSGAFNVQEEVFRLAERGWGILMGTGDHQLDPVHAADIADLAVASMSDPSLHNSEFGFAGPDKYTHTEISELAFEILGKRRRVVHVPLWAVDVLAATIRPFNSNAAGFLQFFRQVADMDMVAPHVGKRRLADLYQSLAREQDTK